MAKSLKVLNTCLELWAGAYEVWSFLLLPGTVQFACQGKDSLARDGRDVFLLSSEEGEGRGVLRVNSMSHIGASITSLKAFAVFFLLPALLYFLMSLLMLISALSGSTGCSVEDICVCSSEASHQRPG